ncbi:MAG TPA: hypothetical protein VNS12_05775 [Pelagibacterium sp.]|uniref:hypothetical protein n=1 Tax=Pelagibacterium sp. TaxID=1967288 RepID=UPI002C8A3D1C|nr:hypothetical protein [Pelagibacterium sp.]HWJ87558.1 hypothetical protein [Pelagibacterium sp.]
MIENERTKLTANFMNAVASGSILVAIIGPLVGMALGTMPAQETWNIVGLSLLVIISAIVLHFLARRVLAGLKE